ncbi:glycosyltransferase [Sphaerobacter thermophilus]|uniref:glycosyltransferase n=1 Tax=Sphaerobacter thermophilus TaxID=2057 RepID=UPI0001A3BECA|nr:glycosyltransferase [Sphaerobacter thermophilus]
MSPRIDAGTREASPPWLEERCDIADIVPDESSPIPPSLTIVVPTRNEAENVGPLVERLDRCLPGQVLEIIFVDDSDDDTVAAIESLERSPDRVIRVIHRPRGERQGGLGGAVVVGLRAARADWVCVMDADLQHPPEVIPSLLERARATHADLVIASRYCGDGSLGRMGELRAAASRATTILAKIVFPGRLRGVTDPMSGFFLFAAGRSTRIASDPAASRSCWRSSSARTAYRWPRCRIALESVTRERARRLCARRSAT